MSSIRRKSSHDYRSPKKRFKSTGVEFQLRKLTYYGDKLQTNDEIHKSIELCPVSHALVDTEAFQRLRNIRQLGMSEYLYTCANGNRFQHSLGVAHLAERMAKTISQEQPNLGATDKDVLCVKLAGLLHDIGHGPFSHLYEQFRDHALPTHLEAHPELQQEYDDCKQLGEVPEHWSHELSSLQMIDAALEELGLQIDLEPQNLDKPLKQIGDGIDARSMRVFKPPGVDDSILTSRDWIFIKECVLGGPLPEVVKKYKKDSFIGRTEKNKEWLYDIVNNKYSGLDVDKIDYFARDAGRTIGSGSIDMKMVEDARVAKALCSRPGKCKRCKGVPGYQHYMICYPLKRVDAAMNFFKNRLLLHTIIYQHKKTVAAGAMLCDILCLADPFFRMESNDGEKYPISRAVLNSEFLMPVDDQVLRDIARSKDPSLAKAQALCRRLRKHDIYKCAADQPLDMEEERGKIISKMKDVQIKQGMMLEKRFWDDEGVEPFPLNVEDFTVEKYYMHHGQKDKNPLSGMRFFEEMNDKLIGPMEDLPTAEPAHEANYRSIIPLSLEKAGVRIYCRDNSKRAYINQVFLQWFERMERGEVLIGDDNDEAVVEMITPACPRAKLEFDNDIEEMDDEEMDHDNDNAHHHHSATVILSQESVDDSDDDEDDGRAHSSSSQLDQSPIPVRTRS